MRIASVVLLLPVAAVAQSPAALFEKHCATCHRPASDTRAPLPDALAKMPAQQILTAMESGSMKAQSAMLSPAERKSLAEFLGAKAPVGEATNAGACPAGSSPKAQPVYWNGWGVDLSNSRFQPAKIAGLSAEQVGKLKLKWAFGFPGSSSVMGQPSVIAGKLYFGSDNGTVYAVDAQSGCTYWTFKAPATVRTAITIGAGRPGRYTAYFGDLKANIHAVDAESGKPLWSLKLDDHPVARITGAPKLYNGRLYIPVSSVEEVSAGNPKYPCCTFRGSVVAVDAESGKQLWKSYTIPDPPTPTKNNSVGTQLSGPAGAAVWLSPTIDLGRKLIYVGTGNGYSDPDNKYTDAVIAFDLETGSMIWSQQLANGDGWNFSCINPNKASCPETSGPDVDIGASPILRRVKDGRDLLLIGQKSGIVHALDAGQKGKIVWQTRIGKGGALGGIQWGMAADDDNVYAALSDINRAKPEEGGGLFAIKLTTGDRAWHAPPPKPACMGQRGCSAAQMQAVSATTGVVFSGSMDGRLRAFSARDGSIIWEFDTQREFETVNRVKARGGSLSAGGPTLAGGWLYVNSGYGSLGGMPGNVLLAFAVE
jgi:polyvinyl alcohol dehydrogenase (cytochrome)